MANDVRLHTPLPVVYLLNIIERMGYHEYIDYSKKQSESVVTKDTDLVNQAMEIQMEKALTTFALNRS